LLPEFVIVIKKLRTNSIIIIIIINSVTVC